jgi:uncharacterized protein (DUF362 family)
MKLKRREFIKQSAAGLAAFGAAKAILPHTAALAPERPAIAAIQGESLPRILARGLEPFGGMGHFVRKGDKVVLLPNPQGTRPGVSTSAQLVGELVKLCLDSGAAEAVVATIHSPGRWYATGIIEATEKAGGKMHYPQSRKDWADISLPKGRRLKKATIIRRAIENDLWINVPVFKQHDSARVTGTLKNLMGFNSDNNSFHQGDEYLHQSIADLASFFGPRLLVVDAFTILAENGPFGPGRTVSPHQVITATDMVAADAYCCRFLEISPEDVSHIRIAHQMGLGDKNLSGLTIVEARA